MASADNLAVAGQLREMAALLEAQGEDNPHRIAADPGAPFRAAPAQPPGQGPSVELLLDVDRRYRAAAEQGRLPTIAPHRFNPEGKSWLPVLHTCRGGWAITALYSNTARAHELGRVRDWVVLYAEDETHHEHQYTVVTATRGSLAGQRVVRGREEECRVLYLQARGDVGGE
jgi:putative hydrolase